jgi:hypothetical protein
VDDDLTFVVADRAPHDVPARVPVRRGAQPGERLGQRLERDDLAAVPQAAQRPGIAAVVGPDVEHEIDPQMLQQQAQAVQRVALRVPLHVDTQARPDPGPGGMGESHAAAGTRVEPSGPEAGSSGSVPAARLAVRATARSGPM